MHVRSVAGLHENKKVRDTIVFQRNPNIMQKRGRIAKLASSYIVTYNAHHTTDFENDRKKYKTSGLGLEWEGGSHGANKLKVKALPNIWQNNIFTAF